MTIVVGETPAGIVVGTYLDGVETLLHAPYTLHRGDRLAVHRAQWHQA